MSLDDTGKGRRTANCAVAIRLQTQFVSETAYIKNGEQ